MRLNDEKFGEMSPYGVRLPSELKAKIKASAKAKRHSMNAEIIERLEKSYNENTGDKVTYSINISKEEAKNFEKLLMEIKDIDLSKFKKGKSIKLSED